MIVVRQVDDQQLPIFPSRHHTKCAVNVVVVLCSDSRQVFEHKVRSEHREAISRRVHRATVKRPAGIAQRVPKLLHVGLAFECGSHPLHCLWRICEHLIFVPVQCAADGVVAR